MQESAVRARAELVAHVYYGRFVAVLAAPTGDVPEAEDALADAFELALRGWPDPGIPHNPEGWHVTVARNRLKDLNRSAARRLSRPLNELLQLGELGAGIVPDCRLELCFLCAHRAIDPSMRTLLMLQMVLGIEAARIARTFVVPAPAMAQRLVRAKRRIRDARIPFVVPEPDKMPGRLPPVLEAIYGAYAVDWQGGETAESGESLAEEALCLALALASLTDRQPEALGLAALIALSLSLSREPARARPIFVPLEEQDTRLWDRELISQGERLLLRAHEFGQPGRYQVEAAIQSLHCDRVIGGETDWLTLRALSVAVMQLAPTLGARVSLAPATAHVEGSARTSRARRLDSQRLMMTSRIRHSSGSSRVRPHGLTCWPTSAAIRRPQQPSTVRSHSPPTRKIAPI
jgi:predicted RNA polymerase sigma factor